MRSMFRGDRDGVILVVLAWSATTFGGERASKADGVEPDLVAPPSIERLVQQALAAELAGDTHRRHALLAQARNSAPQYAPARWHSGQLQWEGNWLAVDRLQQNLAADRRLAEYRQRRDAAGKSVDAHRALAQWCGKNNLPSHAQFHWASVLLTKPRDSDAIAALRLTKWRGQWFTPEGLAHAKQAIADAEAAFEKWQAEIDAIKTDLHGDDARRQAKAMARLKGIRQSDALPAMVASLVDADEWYSLGVIHAIAEMPEQSATNALTWQAVVSPHAKVRQAAAEALKPRPLQSFVPALVGSLTSPLEFSTYFASMESGQMKTGMVVEREMPFSEQRLTITQPLARGGQRLDPRPVQRAAQIRQQMRQISNRIRAEGLLQARIAHEVLTANQVTDAQNQRVFGALEIATGRQFARVPHIWWGWWQEHNELFVAEPKPRLSRAFTDSLTMSCFVAGTPVWTEMGQRPIEQLRPGDRVFSQDPVTGELALKFVIEITTRPASPTFRVEVGDEAIVATRGHPFWATGKGWRMAKELTSDDRLHGIDGAVPIDALSEGPEFEAHNLVIQEFGTYFVGKTGVLVRDNTLRGFPTNPLPGYDMAAASRP